MKTLGYYPGCSLSGTAFEFDLSVRAIAKRLETDLKEVPDWVCCGATSAHAIDRESALALAADSLSKALRAGHREILAPCAMCYQRLAAAAHELREDAELAACVTEALGDPAGTNAGDVRTVNILEWLGGVPEGDWPALVSHPLKGLRVACYYGCLLVRPPGITGVKDYEKPRSMERLVRLAGAEPVRWTMALECCGGSFALSRKDAVLRLSRNVCDAAREAKADIVCLACPMCQSNLDMRQAEFAAGREPLPVLYISQLVGLAMGVPSAELGLESHFVPLGATVESAERRSTPAPARAGA